MSEHATARELQLEGELQIANEQLEQLQEIANRTYHKLHRQCKFRTDILIRDYTELLNIAKLAPDPKLAEHYEKAIQSLVDAKERLELLGP